MSNENKYIIENLNLESIRNRNEVRVVAQLKRVLPDLKNFCGCRVCVEDVYGATLSLVPCQYAQVGSIVVNPMPSDDDIHDKILEAVERVRANPTHPARNISTQSGS